MTYPLWLVLLLTATLAGIEYTQQTKPAFLTETLDFALGLGQVVLGVVLGFQRAATNATRRLRGLPPR